MNNEGIKMKKGLLVVVSRASAAENNAYRSACQIHKEQNVEQPVSKCAAASACLRR